MGLLLWGLRKDDSQMPKRYASSEPPPGRPAPTTTALWGKVREALRYLLPG